MKTIIALYLMFTVSAFCSNDTLVSALEDGEEPGLTHYYFFYAESGLSKNIVRVRWVIDSDLRNSAKVTDFVLGGDGIRVKNMEGAAASRSKLIEGKDAELVTKSEYLISTKDSEHMLIPVPPEEGLTEEQRCDLATLITLLARDRPPLPKSGEPAGAGQPAPRPETKPEGNDKPQPESEEHSR